MQIFPSQSDVHVAAVSAMIRPSNPLFLSNLVMRRKKLLSKITASKTVDSTFGDSKVTSLLFHTSLSACLAMF